MRDTLYWPAPEPRRRVPGESGFSGT